MIRTEESKRLWKLAEASQDWETMEKIEREWEALEIQDDSDSSTSDIDDMDYPEFAAMCDDSDWTDEDEAGLEEYEERKRQRIAEANEY